VEPPALGEWSTDAAAHLPCRAVQALVALCPGPDGGVPVITPAAVEKLRRVTARDFQQLYKHCVMQVRGGGGGASTAPCREATGGPIRYGAAHHCRSVLAPL
jgi:hypothetical protein